MTKEALVGKAPVRHGNNDAQYCVPYRPGVFSVCVVLTAHAYLSALACVADKRCCCSPATRQDLRRIGQHNSRPPDSELLYAGTGSRSVRLTLQSSKYCRARPSSFQHVTGSPQLISLCLAGPVWAHSALQLCPQSFSLSPQALKASPAFSCALLVVSSSTTQDSAQHRAGDCKTTCTMASGGSRQSPSFI